MNITGTTLNGYKILDFIDSGGFGSVYKAVKNGDEYAIKIFREDYVLKEFREKGEENRIKQEIEIMKSVNHPYLIRYVDDFKETLLSVPSYFLVMEYAKGKTLRKLMSENAINESQAIDIFQKILEGIKALHNIRGDEEDKGIIHRDLKPENIIVNGNGDLKIIDYGISKVIDYTSITSTGNVMGSPPYMSPEQITDSKHIDKRSDLYTLGVILYEMLTQNLPYESHSVPELFDKIKNAHPIPPRRWKPLMNNKVENIILKLLEKIPYKRFAKVSLIADAFQSEEIKLTEKVYDLTPKFYLRLLDDLKTLQTFSKNNKFKLFIEFPANHQRQKGLLSLISTNQFEKIIDPATMRLAYPAQRDVKGLQELPYAPPKFQVITPDYLQDNDKKQEYVKQVIDEQFKLGADILVSPYHYIHNTNVPATQRRNPVAEWFDLDIKLLKESIDYKASIRAYDSKQLYAGICLNGDSLLDDRHTTDLLNMFSAFDCDGYFIYVDCIDNSTNGTTLYHYIKTLVELQKNTNKPVIAGRLNSLGLGLLCAGVTAYSSGTARFDSFYEDLYKEEVDVAYKMYERYYFPQLLGTIAIAKKSPVKLQAIMNEFGACNCYYCNGKNYLQMIETPNNKLHFLENIHNEIESIKSISQPQRIPYFLRRIEEAINNHRRLPDVFKTSDYQHLLNWKEVFEELNK